MPSVPFQRQLEEARNLLQAQRADEALKRYQSLAALCPRVSTVWFEYGNAASALGKYELADELWRKAIDVDPHNTELVSLIGHRYKAMRQTARAIEFFEKAAQVDSKAINPRISLAVLLEQIHQLARSREWVNQCLSIDPKDDQARYFTAVLDRRENKISEAESALRDLIASDPRHPFVQYACRYELAQLVDRENQFDEAMALLYEAKKIVRALTDCDELMRSYDRAAESGRRFAQSQPRTILSTWASFFPERKREPIPPLAFLGGHPRSGTTLLEQILDAHPGVAAIDEPSAFLDVLQPAFYKSSELSSQRVNQLRRTYIEALKRDAGSDSGGRLLLDKNPSPTARLPIWLRIFPELRVMIALRDPRDVILSCFFQNIPLNIDNVNFLSVERVAKHYADLMDVWLAVREWEGFAWIETRYEDVVADMEKEGRRATEFLDLEWHSDQVQFYEKSRGKQMYSPTYQDVTRPVYRRAVARWKSYEKHLEPAFGVLQPYVEKFGYS